MSAEGEMLFFQEKNNRSTIQAAAEFLRVADYGSDFLNSCRHHSLTILDNMLANPVLWDRYCEINIKWIGDTFIGALTKKQRSC